MKDQFNFSYNEIFERNKYLIGEEGLGKLKNAKVSIFGVGGVGSFLFESLVRSGIGEIFIYDFDKYEASNINRQIGSTIKTIGENKVFVLEQMAKEINPNIKIHAFNIKLTEENIPQFQTNIIADCIDDTPSKIALIEKAYKEDKIIFSAMGAGGRINPLMITYSDISKVSHCPFAKKVKKLLKEKGIERGITAIYSREKPEKPIYNNGNTIQPSMIFVPSVMGIIMGSLIVKKVVSN